MIGMIAYATVRPSTYSECSLFYCLIISNRLKLSHTQRILSFFLVLDIDEIAKEEMCCMNFSSYACVRCGNIAFPRTAGSAPDTQERCLYS